MRAKPPSPPKAPPKPPESQLIRLGPGNVVHTVNEAFDAKPFVSDVQYLTHFAVDLAECIGARTIEYLVLEDGASQIAFYHTHSQDGRGTVVNGILTQPALPPEEALERLCEE